MKRQAGKTRPLVLLFLAVAVTVALLDLQIVEAQRKRPAPQGASQAKPKPSPKPRTALEEMGAPPPVPTLKKQPEQDVSEGDVVSVDTTEVMFPVTVRDSSGRLVNNLTRDDFRVFENNAPQPLSDLALRQVPVDVVLMVDASSSVANNLDDFRRAAQGFAAKLAADDRISLIKFDDRIELLQDWTKSRFQLQRALNRIEPGMYTRFNDALLLASRDQFGAPALKSRRAVIVLSDGLDNGQGTTTLEAALQAMIKAQVTAYIVSNTEISRATKRAELDSLLGGTDASIRFNQVNIDRLRLGLQALDKSEENLAQLARATGGRLYKPQTFDALESTYAEVADELRHQYALYFTPLNKSRDGSFRRVRVETSNPAYRPHTRVGYFAPKS
ncbi:MAG TPA: VWA domain-containing protein [Pyrinomonadaceae bacterium]|jgi:Ca-activated chloride channel family protein|nr:VWA domain-containing protein [Pyrinomonadaceae bacterium]